MDAMTSHLDRDAILQLLRKEAGRLASQFHVRKLGLFGSFMRGEETPGSDVDILVVIEPVTFDNYMDLKFFLEDLCGRPVDLVLEDSLKPRLKRTIPNQAIYVEGLHALS